MAEMTVEQAIESLQTWLQFDDVSTTECNQISALIEQQQQQIDQQAAEIAASEQKYKNWIGPIEYKSMLDEIAKKDRMILAACREFDRQNHCSSCKLDMVCSHGADNCAATWLAWLEKEAQG